MELEKKHIAPYLPFGLECIVSDKEKAKLIATKSECLAYYGLNKKWWQFWK